VAALMFRSFTAVYGRDGQKIGSVERVRAGS
jgi:hypothetical protein